MNKEQKMVVVNMDVGNRNAASKCSNIAQTNSPIYAGKASDRLSISKSNCACIAYGKNVQ
jgi:hypothetical protein